jgi:hypothetical protein
VQRVIAYETENLSVGGDARDRQSLQFSEDAGAIAQPAKRDFTDDERV